MAEFKDRLKELRKEKGITQKKLADYLQTTKETISRYENGIISPTIGVSIMKNEKGQDEIKTCSESAIRKWELAQRRPTSSNLIELAQFFNVSTDYLLGLSDEKQTGVIVKEIKISDISTDDLLEEIKRRLEKKGD